MPGSDSSALQQRYLSIVALRDEARLLAHREAGAAAAAQAGVLELVRAPSSGVHLGAAPCAAPCSRRGARRRRSVQAGLVDVLEQAELGEHPSARSSPGQPVAGVAEAAAGQRLAALLDRARRSRARRSGRAARRSGRRPRPSAPCRRRRGTRTRGSRCPRGLRLGLLGDRVETRLRVAQAAGDAGADVHVAARRRAACVEHVVEGRDRGQVGGRDLHHRGDLVDRLGRAPAVHALGGVQRRHRGRVAVGVACAMWRLDLALAARRARRPRRGRGRAPAPCRGRLACPSRRGRPRAAR